MSKSLKTNCLCFYKIVSSDYVIKELYLENTKITTNVITKKLQADLIRIQLVLHKHYDN